MTSLVEQLRAYLSTNEWGDGVHHEICDLAADRIEQLESALAVFANIKADDGDTFERWHPSVVIPCEVMVGNIQQARRALKGKSNVHRIGAGASGFVPECPTGEAGASNLPTTPPAQPSAGKWRGEEPADIAQALENWAKVERNDADQAWLEEAAAFIRHTLTNEGSHAPEGEA